MHFLGKIIENKSIKLFFNQLIKSIFLIVFFIFMITLYIHWRQHLPKKFCDSILINTYKDDIIKIAKDNNLNFIQSVQNGETIIHFVNTEGPFFRFSCSINFDKNDQAKEKKLLAFD